MSVSVEDKKNFVKFPGPNFCFEFFQVDRNGNSVGSMRDKKIKLSGPHSVINRSVMIHADQDDLGKGDNSQPGIFQLETKIIFKKSNNKFFFEKSQKNDIIFKGKQSRILIYLLINLGVNGKTSKTTGNAGARIGCGKIEYTSIKFKLQ